MAALRFALTLLVLVLAESTLAGSTCGVPPEFWCDSLEISTQCNVTKQCEEFGQSSSRPVNISLYYESLCPGCKQFLTTQLNEAFHKIPNITNITLVPFGNALMHADKTVPGGFTFDCQHGREECIGNKIETCAIHYYPTTNAHFPFINCVEKSNSLPRVVAPSCAKKHNLNYTLIKECIKPSNAFGVGLEVAMGNRTNALNPQHEYTPWILVNGVHSEKLQTKAQTNLVKLVCETYTGTPKPHACSKHSNLKVTSRD